MFFSSFPKTAYTFDYKNQSPAIVTNIFTRIRMRAEVLQNALSYYKYQIRHGDTPETVAFKEYGDPRLHWIICLVNNFTDPHFDFPLDDKSLDRMIISKYGYSTIDQAYAAIHHYELEKISTLSEVNGPTTITTNTFTVTLDQYNYATDSLVTNALFAPSTSTVSFRANNADPNTTITSTLSIKSTYKPVYVYDYEAKENDDKRNIKLLKSTYIEAVVSELDNIING